MKKFTVTAINNYVKAVLTSDPTLGNLAIEGEISNFKLHSSGHCYFTLKDAGGVLKCVMFRSQASKLTFKPKDGMKVEAQGSISVYERDGVYQLYVNAMKQAGVGDLYEEFEKTKKKLGEEGLFDMSRKKALPYLPEIVGAVTSPTGAVIQDIRNVLFRRFPNMRLRLFPIAVQGEGVAEGIEATLKFINDHRLCDVIILGRGGGSIEDLWGFNEEKTARAIAASEIPVISAVGHETDFTIADFVADMRAPTPSAAAELAVPEFADLKYAIQDAGRRLAAGPKHKAEMLRTRLTALKESRVFKHPESMLSDKRETLDRMTDDLQYAAKNILQAARHGNEICRTKLSSMNPMAVLDRGYGIIKNTDGKVVTNEAQLKSGEEFEVVLHNSTLGGIKK